MGKRLLVGAGVLAVVVLGVGVWWFVLRDDSVEKATVECDPAPCEASTVESLDGTWQVVPGESRGTIVITEEIAGVVDHQAEGRTGEVTGSVTVAGDEVTGGSFTVDLTALEFTDDPGGGINVANRANAMRTQGLETDEFPEATFALTAPIALGGDVASGETVTAEATGDLTIHGVTRSVTFEVQAVADGDRVRVTPSDFVPVALADFDMSVDGPPFVAAVSDEGSFDFLLVLEQA